MVPLSHNFPRQRLLESALGAFELHPILIFIICKNASFVNQNTAQLHHQLLFVS